MGLGLRELLGSNDEKSTEKVASTSKGTVTDKTITEAVNEALKAGTAKTASDNKSPGNDLEKIASELIGSDRLGEIKHAQLVGAAMADGFYSRLDALNKAASVVEEEFSKAASERITPEDLQLLKEAKENPAEFLRQVQAGMLAKEAAEKQAAAQYTYEQTTKLIHEKTAEHFMLGYNATNDLIASL